MGVDTKSEAKYSALPFFQAQWFWVAVIALVLVLGGGWIIFSRNLIGDSMAAGGNTAALDPAPVTGHPAPDFELASPTGETIHLSDFKGTPVIVNFWATWCGPCRAEFPEFLRAAVDNADKLVIIGINNTVVDQANLVPGFLQEFGITFPIVLDKDGETAKTYRIIGLPTTIFIDSNGVINEVFTGPLNKAYIESKISELSSS